MKHSLLRILLIPIVCLALSSPIWAQDPTQDEVDVVAEKLNCPTCQGINLADCQTQTCQQWREQIYDLLAEDYTEAEILDYFASQYGDRVLQEPPRRGFALWVWVIPVVGLAAGAIWLVFLIRAWSGRTALAMAPVDTGPGPAENDSSDDLVDGYVAQVERDLEQY
jgi:cytochrome c-type biogenesis protein CcmH/NrfF